MKLKHASAVAAILALTGLFGCQASSPRGGGMASDDGFRILLPQSQLTLKQGAIQSVDVTVVRGDQFKQDIKLDLKSGPQGITVDPKNYVIKASDRPESQVRVSAAKDAALGEYRVTITGTPASNGQPTMTHLRVDVIAP